MTETIISSWHSMIEAIIAAHQVKSQSTITNWIITYPSSMFKSIVPSSMMETITSYLSPMTETIISSWHSMIEAIIAHQVKSQSTITNWIITYPSSMFKSIVPSSMMETITSYLSPMTETIINYWYSMIAALIRAHQMKSQSAITKWIITYPSSMLESIATYPSSMMENQTQKTSLSFSMVDSQDKKACSDRSLRGSCADEKRHHEKQNGNQHENDAEGQEDFDDDDEQSVNNSSNMGKSITTNPFIGERKSVAKGITDETGAESRVGEGAPIPQFYCVIIIIVIVFVGGCDVFAWGWVNWKGYKDDDQEKGPLDQGVVHFANYLDSEIGTPHCSCRSCMAEACCLGCVARKIKDLDAEQVGEDNARKKEKQPTIKPWSYGTRCYRGGECSENAGLEIFCSVCYSAGYACFFTTYWYQFRSKKNIPRSRMSFFQMLDMLASGWYFVLWFCNGFWQFCDQCRVIWTIVIVRNVLGVVLVVVLGFGFSLSTQVD